jgi:hypothetical protein
MTHHKANESFSPVSTTANLAHLLKKDERELQNYSFFLARLDEIKALTL